MTASRLERRSWRFSKAMCFLCPIFLKSTLQDLVMRRQVKNAAFLWYFFYFFPFQISFKNDFRTEGLFFFPCFSPMISLSLCGHFSSLNLHLHTFTMPFTFSMCVRRLCSIPCTTSSSCFVNEHLRTVDAAIFYLPPSAVLLVVKHTCRHPARTWRETISVCMILLLARAKAAITYSR